MLLQIHSERQFRLGFTDFKKARQELPEEVFSGAS